MVEGSPVYVFVEGGDRSVNVLSDLELTNAGSYDPDSPNATDPTFECTWSCEDWTGIGINPYYSSSIDEIEANGLDDEDKELWDSYTEQA